MKSCKARKNSQIEHTEKLQIGSEEKACLDCRKSDEIECQSAMLIEHETPKNIEAKEKILIEKTEKKLLPEKTKNKSLPGGIDKKLLPEKTEKKLLPENTKKKLLPKSGCKAQQIGQTHKLCIGDGSFQRKAMADKEELLMVLDEDGNSTGKLELRSVVHKENLWHNEVAIWIVDPKTREVMLQRRSPNKSINPNKLGLCAGHVVGNNTIQKTLKDEFFEELGLNLNDFEPVFLKKIKREEEGNHNYSFQVCVFERIPLNAVKIQEEELTEVIYMPLDKLKRLYSQKSDEIVFKSPAYAEIFKIIEQNLDNFNSQN